MSEITETEYRTEMLSCPLRVMPPEGAAALSLIHSNILAKNYCCGLRFPHLLRGLRVMSLGCGSVRDCFVLSKLIGQKGHVVGVDPTDHVVSFGEQYLDSQREAAGYSETNVSFIKSDIDTLLDAGLQPNSFDLVCFNTVLGLTPKKREAMGQLQQLLKTGGEVFFTEMIASSRVRDEVKKDQSLWVEGLAGAFYWDDLARMAHEFGFSTPRLYQATAMRIKEPDLDEFIGGVKYSMATYRMFRLPANHSDHEEVMVYKNPDDNDSSMNSIKFDWCNQFKTDEPVRVDGEMVTILRSSRYSDLFRTTTGSSEATTAPCVVNPFEI